MIRWFRLGCLLFCFAAGVNAVADEGTGPEPDCLLVLSTVQSQTDLALLEFCADDFWHHPEKEPLPGSFNAILTLGNRMLELEPLQEDLYGTLAWLLWSKWATWHRSPSEMPDGAGKDLQAIEMLQRGGRLFPDSPSYWASAVAVIFPLAKAYQPGLYPMLIDWSLKVDRLGDLKQQVRARLDLGLLHLRLQQMEEAKVWFRRVLEIDPENPTAIRKLKELGTIL